MTIAVGASFERQAALGIDSREQETVDGKKVNIDGVMPKSFSWRAGSRQVLGAVVGQTRDGNEAMVLRVIELCGAAQSLSDLVEACRGLGAKVPLGNNLEIIVGAAPDLVESGQVQFWSVQFATKRATQDLSTVTSFGWLCIAGSGADHPEVRQILVGGGWDGTNMVERVRATVEKAIEVTQRPGGDDSCGGEVVIRTLLLGQPGSDSDSTT